MLQKNPKYRLSAEDALQDPWIQKQRNWQMQSLSRDLQLRIMNNYRYFNANLKLQQAVLTLMVNQLINDEEMED